LRDREGREGLPGRDGHAVTDLIEFGSFRLDTAKRVLWRGRDLVSVPPKALDLLVALVEQRGDVVPKEELLRRVWPDTFVEEANLSVNASILRKVLGTQEDGRPFLENVPRRGYRFVADTRVQSASGPPSLAVLPFRTLGGASEDEYLGVGMADALIARLGRSGQVIVRPTRTILKYADLAADPRVAGKELKVDAVLDGTLQRDGARLRVSAQLLPVGRALSSWSASFETTFTSLFAVQDAVADQVAQALALTLDAPQAPAAAQRRGPDVGAYQAYLKGRYFWNRLTREGVGKAFQFFEEARSRDDAYAAPWAGLADAYAVLGFTGFLPPRDAWSLAGEAARGAVARDETLPEARVTLAYVRLFQDWDWAGATEELERAVALDPHSAAAHQWYGLFLDMRGRLAEAERQLALAAEIDPLSVVIVAMRGFQRDLARDFEGGERFYRQAVELDPHHFVGHWGLGLAHQHAGRFAEGVAAHRQAAALLEGAAFARAVLARSLALAGQEAEARDLLRELSEGADGYVSPYQRATVLDALGRVEEALTCLEEAGEQRDAWLAWLDVDPMLDRLRAEPRFLAVRNRVMGA
jgi:DNA-binding winged helix-turn-helix (wHTH) protein/tetratricopeptide (TPR) repeat protein